MQATDLHSISHTCLFVSSTNQRHTYILVLVDILADLGILLSSFKFMIVIKSHYILLFNVLKKHICYYIMTFYKYDNYISR